MTDTLVSMFANATSPVAKTCKLTSVLDAIKNGTYAEKIKALRELRKTDPEAYNTQKKNLPAFTVSGTAKDRKTPLEHSALIQGDIDHLNGHNEIVREYLKNDPHIAFGFVSPSGDGLKFGIAIDPTDHAAGFLAAQEYIRKTYNLEIDPSVKDRLRLCFVSHDPDLWINPSAIPVPPVPKNVPRAKPDPKTPPSGNRSRIAESILGPIEWESDLYGFCSCPGAHLHTTPTKPKDCDVRLEGSPTIHCFHGSCQNIVDGVNWKLRSLIGKAEFVPAPRQANPGYNEYVPSDNDGGTEFEQSSTPEQRSKEWVPLLEYACDSIASDPPKPVEIIEGLITEQSKVVIGGGSKTYKTWISIQLALCCSAASEFLGRKCLKQSVLYVNLELKPKTFKRRLKIVAEYLKLDIAKDSFAELHLRGKLAKLTPDMVVDRIIQAALACKASLVMLDPVYKVNTIGDENSSRDQTILFNHLDRITTEANTTLVLNDHFSKGNQSEKDPLDAIRGSSAKGGDVDAAIVLRAHQEKNCFRVDVVHRELPPVDPFCLGWLYPIMEIRDDLDPDMMKKPKSGRPKLDLDPATLLKPLAVRSDPYEPISKLHWSILLGISDKTLASNLAHLRAKGFIQTVGEGQRAKSQLTPKGKNFVSE